MCWSTNKKPMKRIATDDIPVYKYVNLVTKRKFPWFWKKEIIAAISDIVGYRYIPYLSNRPVEVLPINSEAFYMEEWIINAGYHSVLTEDTEIVPGLLPNVKFIIPKGATYYLNEDNEIVSSNIIMTDELVNQKYWKFLRS